jgi:hypothetical protein
VLLLIGNNFPDNFLTDNFPVAGKAVNQRCIAKDIDHSGDAAGRDRDQAQASSVKSNRRDPTASRRNAM